MSTRKAALKAAKVALDNQEYENAAEIVRNVLKIDPDNYHANVFLGLALDKLNRDDASEQAYQQAVQIKNNDALVWQGLISLYEKQAAKKVDENHDAAIRLAMIYMEADDKTRCQTVVDKYVAFAKKYGSQQQYKRALEILLPTSPVFDYLEGRIINPAYSYIKIAEISEAEEQEKINSEIGHRRTRLGAKLDQVVKDVKKEVLIDSNLESLYANVINWADDDEIRRQYEEKLLFHAYETLGVLDLPKKGDKQKYVYGQAEGFVVLKHPFTLAWKIVLEWKDVEEIEGIDGELLRDYISLFPHDGLSKVLRGYLESEVSPFTKIEEKNEDDQALPPMAIEDRLILMTEGLEESRSSALCHRLMSELFLSLEEYDSAAAAARKAQELLTVESQLSGLSLSCSYNAIKTLLATSLIHYQSPRNHPEARVLFESILQENSSKPAALIGLGLILEEEEDYDGALNFLAKASKANPDPKIRAEAAWCRALRGDYELALQELQSCLPEMQGSNIKLKTLRAQTLYRIGVCMWENDTSRGARKDRDKSYARFISALQEDVNFAPAYTSLGFFYADYAKDKLRARKCFQKALELSASEVRAAEHLAKLFADTREWTLVEAVAQRVIESGKIRPAPGSKKKGLSWPFRALGIAQLERQEFHDSMVSFQTALRQAPQDFHSWVGLGESYHNSGRYVAAIKALEHALSLLSTADAGTEDDTYYCKFMLANVKSDVGLFDAALAIDDELLSVKPTRDDINLMNLRRLISKAWQNIELGFFGQAAKLAKDAIELGVNMFSQGMDENDLWKIVGDACSVFSWVQSYADQFPIIRMHELFAKKLSLGVLHFLQDIDGIGGNVLESSAVELDKNTYLQAAINATIIAHKQSLRTCPKHADARAAAWHNLGWIEYRAYYCSLEGNQTDSKRRKPRFLRASISCFKKAIECRAGNPEFWGSLGVVTATLNPKVAQHCFVRSLCINEKSARTWTNLGVLYLSHHDYDLANQTFARAQATDPDYADAWLGQGMLARQVGNTEEVYNILKHAFEIANSSSTAIKEQYALSAFDRLKKMIIVKDETDYIQPRLALQQLHCLQLNNLAIDHLSALFDERLNDFSTAEECLTRICSELEVQFEASESTDVLTSFTLAKSDLARIHLTAQDFESALQAAEVAIDLSADGDRQGMNRSVSKVAAHLSAGLAHYHAGSSNLAIEMFRKALEEIDDDPEVICLLVQVLWSTGGSNEKSVARDQLSTCAEKFPNSSGALTLLVAISILDKDLETIHRLLPTLQKFRNEDSLSFAQIRRADQLLSTVATLFPPNSNLELSQSSEAMTSIVLRPSQYHGWARLASVCQEPYPAKVALLNILEDVKSGGQSGAEELCKVYSRTALIADAQRAIMAAPWMSEGWKSFIKACK